MRPAKGVRRASAPWSSSPPTTRRGAAGRLPAPLLLPLHPLPDKAEMQAIVKLHYPDLKERLLGEAMELFFELRAVEGLRKKPSTSELLDWIRLLLADDIAPRGAAATGSQGKLVPLLYGALLKTEQDLHLFEKLAFLARRGG